jgi:hypothetical protein
MTPVRCPACGQPTVSPVMLPPIKQGILEMMRCRPGIDSENLRALVWADDPEGGPESWQCLYVHVWQLNRLLSPHGIIVRGSRSCGYCVVSLGKAAS